MSQLPDQKELWKKFQKGNRHAFEMIYREFYASLYYYALKITSDKPLAQECVQDLFITLWRTKKRLTGVSNIKPYLFKSLNRLIARSAPSLNSGLQVVKNETGLTFSPEDLLIEQEDDRYKREVLTDVLNSLPARQREVIYLKYYEDMSYSEIAETMQINYQSVINLIYKGFRKLRDKTSLKKLISDYSAFPFLLLSMELF